MRWWVFVGIVALYLCRIDLWLWSEGRIVFGLPVGLLYHLIFCFVLVGFFSVVVRLAWPAELEQADAALVRKASE